MLDIRAMENWRQTNKMDIKPSAGLKKRLFDEPETEDHLQSDLKKEMKEIQKADRLRWNYDFTRDIPLPGGRYKWELGVNTSTPESTGCEGSGCESIDRSSESESDCSLNSPTSSTASPPLRTFVTSTVFDSPATQRRLPGWYLIVCHTAYFWIDDPRCINQFCFLGVLTSVFRRNILIEKFFVRDRSLALKSFARLPNHWYCLLMTM